MDVVAENIEEPVASLKPDIIDPCCSQISLFVPTELNHYQQSYPGSRRMTFDRDHLPLQFPTNGMSRRLSPNLARQKKLILELLQSGIGSKLSLNTLDNNNKHKELEKLPKNYNRRVGDDKLTTILSAFYAKFVVVLGIAFPVTEILSLKAPPSFYQGFYLYLYLVSVAFVIFIFVAHLRQRTLFTAAMLYSNHTKTDRSNSTQHQQTTSSLIEEHQPTVRFGSFYLRIGAIAFGIGSMVYSGLEFGQYFELKKDSRCQNPLIALSPAARMILSIVQMQFIFLNTKDLGLNKHRSIARFGLMHMIATNLCEWLYVLVEETKHETDYLAHKEFQMLNLNNGNNATSTDITGIPPSHHNLMRRATAFDIVIECRRTNIMGSLVQEVSPFLFPCTIEYSLICAVILFEMWKKIRGVGRKRKLLRKISTNEHGANHYTVDCTRAHRGIFAGILVIVLTIISLILYFELIQNPNYKHLAIFEVSVSEGVLYTMMIFALSGAMYYVRDLRHSKSYGSCFSLDCSLLIVAQSGIYIYAMFSIVGSYFSSDTEDGMILAMGIEILSLVQTSMQSLFILNAWWRRCRSSREIRCKPGREIVTFLIIANMSLWIINTLIKGRAMFRPSHLQFFGEWAWTIITHVSMPLAIFYRFHSTICLFEIWKTTYKGRTSINY